MDIPYSAEPRPDTRLTNAMIGTWLFIASEVMLFGSLFSAYAVLRTGATAWPNQGAILNVPLASFNTLVLVTSSVAMLRARRAIETSHPQRFRSAMGVVVALGVIFLGIKAFEYTNEFARGLQPATSNFLGLYFVMTALHALHVAGGVLVNGWLLFHRPADGTVMQRAHLRTRVRAAATYWHFVDGVWLVMFMTLYLS
jgi:cytochrome c oxidase subunit 3